MVISRAENKLAGAVSAFSYDFRGKIVLDIGSSTGGFTEYATRAGAEKVIAVEKGTKQMKAPLRFHKKVELHEKTDIFEVRVNKISSVTSGRADKIISEDTGEKTGGKNAGTLVIEQPDTIVADVSFVSLRKILLYVREHLADFQTDLLVMLKPQFEAKRAQLLNGVVKNEKMRRGIISDFEQWLKRNGFLIIKKHDNEVKGKNGNRERFYFLKLAIR